jgi:hypothetical protein
LTKIDFDRIDSVKLILEAESITFERVGGGGVEGVSVLTSNPFVAGSVF